MKQSQELSVALAIISIVAVLSGALVISEGITELVGMGLMWFVLLPTLAISLFLSSLSEWNLTQKLILWIVGCTEFIVLLALTGPAYHYLLMPFFVNPWIIQILIILIVFALIALYLLSKDASIAGALCFIFGVVLVLVIAMFASDYSSCAIAETISVEEIFNLPAMDEDYIRTTPKMVSTMYAIDMCQYPRHKPYTPPDIVMMDNEPYWSYILSPDGIFNVYNIKPIGVAYVDMTTMSKSVDIREETFKYSDGIGMKDELQWQILQDQYYIDLDRPMVFMHEGEQYIAKPYITYEHRFTFPVWYTVPRWGGVYLVDSDGTLTDLSPSEAMESEILLGQKIFPEKLVNRYILSQNFWKAKGGDYIGAILNVWFDHIKQIEITDVSTQGNEQPFLLNTEDGLKWTVSVEPYGQSHGIYAIYLLDARTGDVEVKRFFGEEIGPVAACDYVRKDNDKVDWSRFDVVEPIPVTPNGKLYWEVRVVPNDGRGISFVAFVNPIDGDVVECKNDYQIREFIRSQAVDDNETDDRPTIIGTLTDIDTYVYDGYSNWVLEINSTNIYVAKSEMLGTEAISIITLLDIGDEIEFSTTSKNYITNLWVL